MARIVSVSADQSQISTDKSVCAADNTEVVTVYVTAKQNRVDANLEALPFGPGLAATQVVLSVTPSTGVTITQPTGAVNASGTVSGSFRSSSAGTVNVTATVNGATIAGGATVVMDGDAPVDPPSGDPFYEMGTTQSTVKQNTNGFTWSTPNDSQRVVVEEVPAGRSGWGIRFRYGPEASGSDSSAEQRFNMGQDLSELWLEYDIWIPANFALRADSPANNKFLALWPTSYSTVGDTYVVTEFERNGTDTSRARMLGYGDMFYNNGTTIRSGDAVMNSNFINAAKAGTWNTVRVHYRLASGAGQTDGVYEGWLNGDLMWRSRTDWQFWSTGGNNFVRNGYLMGWANSGYTLETDFFIYGGKWYSTDPGWEGQT